MFLTFGSAKVRYDSEFRLGIVNPGEVRELRAADEMAICCLTIFLL
jgi:hypothetical protein